MSQIYLTLGNGSQSITESLLPPLAAMTEIMMSYGFQAVTFICHPSNAGESSGEEDDDDVDTVGLGWMHISSAVAGPSVT